MNLLATIANGCKITHNLVMLSALCYDAATCNYHDCLQELVLRCPIALRDLKRISHGSATCAINFDIKAKSATFALAAGTGEADVAVGASSAPPQQVMGGWEKRFVKGVSCGAQRLAEPKWPHDTHTNQQFTSTSAMH